jgi:putative membrane protein insertion efficiency factor
VNVECADLSALYSCDFRSKAAASRRTPKMRFVLISLLKFYKAVISPWLPPSCRFTPTCSEYAREAIERHGAIKGTGMAIWRLLRCQPFCAGGYDPVK